MRNRRNYYRVLHVQRDAPTAVIRSCYRALMHTLEMHPDRGGDHWNAALLNEAYAVLSCDERRAAYDLTLAAPRRGSGSGPAEPTPAGGSPRSTNGFGFCAFCGRQHGREEIRCGGCDGPLTLDLDWAGSASGRRACRRLAIDRDVRVDVDWPSTDPAAGRINDLSPGGVRLALDRAIAPHEIVRVDADVLSAVARIAHCREAIDGRYTIGVEFFTLRLPRTTGVFLSVSG